MGSFFMGGGGGGGGRENVWVGFFTPHQQSLEMLEEPTQVDQNTVSGENCSRLKSHKQHAYTHHKTNGMGSELHSAEE
jgi:hypothetical protein